METHTMFKDNKKKSILPKFIHSFNTIPIKVSSRFVLYRQDYLKIHIGKNKETRIAKII